MGISGRRAPFLEETPVPAPPPPPDIRLDLQGNVRSVQRCRFTSFRSPLPPGEIFSEDLQHKINCVFRIQLDKLPGWRSAEFREVDGCT